MFYRRCRHITSTGRCRLDFGHATGHQARPTLWEWIKGWIMQGREGDEKDAD